MELLQLSPAGRAAPSGPDRLYWMTESTQEVWSLPHSGALAALLSQPAAAAAILLRFAAEERESAFETLNAMVAHGLVEPLSDVPSSIQRCREFGVAPAQLKRKRWIEGATAMALDPETGAALVSALAASGVSVREDGALRVIAAADYLDARVERLHRDYLRQGCAWMLAKLTGEEIWVGPVFRAGQTACWQCLAARLRERRWLETQLGANAGRPPPARTEEHRLYAAAGFAAQEAARWLLDAPDHLENAVWSFSWATLKTRRHTLTRAPRCPDCGRAKAEPPDPEIALRRAGAVWSAPGDLRTHAAREVLDRLEFLSSPITGILRRFERRDLAPSPPLYTYGAVHNVALPPEPLRIPGAILQPGACSGRGWTSEEARAACLAEAVERYSLQFRGDEPAVQARFADLGEAAIHPGRVQLFSENQFEGREDWNGCHNLDEAVPERFDPREEIAWSSGWSLTARTRRFLPMALHLQYHRPPGKRWIGDADAAGCAAGGRLEEAVLHALLELVERDALGIWWYNGLSRPAFGAASLGDPLCGRVCRELAAQGWDVRVEDITTDAGIPAMVAVGVNRDGRWAHGSSAHIHRAMAVRQAICELWQLSHSPPRPGAPPACSALESRQLETGPLAGPSPDVPAPDFKDAIEECCAKLARAGHEVIVFDLTRPEIAFPVVRVVAPGLRPAKPRFGPGRLYDVPVRLGWLPAPRRESEFPTVSP